MAIEVADGARLRDADAAGLIVIVGQHQGADFIGHRFKQLVAFVGL